MVKQTTSKTTTKAKLTTTKKASATPKKVVEKVEAKETVVKEKAPVKKIFKQSEGILCRSVVNGIVVMEGARSSMPYQWSGYGDEVEVEYRDLVAAVREKNGYVMNPWLIVLDDDFIAEYPFLEDIYAKQYTTNDLADVLRLSVPQMLEEIEKMPTNVKKTIEGMAATWINDGRLDSVKKINALDEVLGTNLHMLAEVVNE